MDTNAIPAEKVVAVAKSWIGRSFRPGVGEQCAPFVRYVFAEAGVPVGNAVNPTDAHLLGPQDYLGEGYANSFAGDDVGIRVNLADVLPGDIVMFANTYGSWNSGVITHVGIYVGGDMMVDRPTASGPVQHRSVYTFAGGPCEIRRPKALNVPRTRISLENGQLTAMRNGTKSFRLDVKVQLKDGSCAVWVDNAPVMPKSVFVKVKDKFTGHFYRLSMQDGCAKASSNNVGIPQFHCRFNLQGGALHIYLNHKEIQSSEAAVEIAHFH